MQLINRQCFEFVWSSIFCEHTGPVTLVSLQGIFHMCYMRQKIFVEQVAS